MYVIEKADKVYGDIDLEGSKNAALPIIIASCLCSEKVVLKNVPVYLNDISILIGILQEMGFKISKENSNTLIIYNNPNSISYKVSEDGSKIRISLLLLSLILHKSKRVSIPKPGGCKIGDRKYDIHIDSLNKMGAKIIENENLIFGTLDGKFQGADLTFHTATTTGTENVILAAVLAEGKTIIRNANTRPEVIDLINFLNRMGANIKYRTRYIEINGVAKLRGGEYRITNGRDEAVTYMILAGMTRGEIRIKDFTTEFCQTDVNLLREIGIDIFEWGGDTYVSAKNKELKPFSMATSPYPGINSDLQPLFAALAVTIEGESIITDMRFTNRFQYVEEFKKLGIDIENYGNCAIIQGGKEIVGTKVTATDLRCGAALVLLGSVAKGKTSIENAYQINRGYSNIDKKLNSVGCQIHQRTI